MHESLSAYPNAVVSLKDPRSGTIFYVESDGRKLAALAGDGRVLWIVDIFAATKMAPGPLIRNLRLNGDALWVTCGKSDTFKVEVGSGKVRYEGSD